jgi:hypothetical protein
MKSKKSLPLLWFTFRQNNSGGHFDVDQFVAEYVIIQARDSFEACDIAEKIGIYFNGVEDGRDCDCCGDRWNNFITGTESPEIYGQLPDNEAAVRIYPHGAENPVSIAELFGK